jgi:hypothetical protein
VAGARPAGVSGEVRLAGAADVKALCEELREGSADAAAGLYVLPISSMAFRFAPYDKKRARLAVDLDGGFRAPTGAYELTPAGAGLAEIALPVSAKEAAVLIKQSKAAELTLWLWFRPAMLPEQEVHCATVYGPKGEGVRLGIEPMAFALTHGDDTVASGETEGFAALRAADGPVTEPQARVGAVVVTGENTPAPGGVSRSARALGAQLLECYEKGLASDPMLRGSLVVGVSIKASGKVGEARTEIDGLGAPEVTACALARIRAAGFPAGEAMRVSFPVRFDQAD